MAEGRRRLQRKEMAHFFVCVTAWVTLKIPENSSLMALKQEISIIPGMLQSPWLAEPLPNQSVFPLFAIHVGSSMCVCACVGGPRWKAKVSILASVISLTEHGASCRADQLGSHLSHSGVHTHTHTHTHTHCQNPSLLCLSQKQIEELQVSIRRKCAKEGLGWKEVESFVNAVNVVLLITMNDCSLQLISIMHMSLLINSPNQDQMLCKGKCDQIWPVVSYNILWYWGFTFRVEVRGQTNEPLTSDHLHHPFIDLTEPSLGDLGGANTEDLWVSLLSR